MPLKILVLVKSFSPITETFIYQDVLALQRENKVLVVCMQRHNEGIRPFQSVKQLDVARIRRPGLQERFRRRLGFGMDFRDEAIQNQLANILSEFEPDIIHAHFGIQALQFLDNLSFSGPIFISFHGYDATRLVRLRKAYRRRLHELFNDKMIFPIAVSSFIVRFLQEYGLSSPRMQVLHCGIDTQFFSPNHAIPRSDEKLLVQVAAFREKKGHAITLKAFAQLVHFVPDLSCRLILGGSGPLEKNMKQLAVDLGVQDKIDFKGWLNELEVRNVLARADAVVHHGITSPSGDMEGIPVAIMEGMAMELPILSTSHAGIPELVEHGVNGLLVPERAIDEFAKQMQIIVSWGPQPQNRVKVEKYFSVRAHLAELLKAYYNALSASGNATNQP